MMLGAAMKQIEKSVQVCCPECTPRQKITGVNPGNSISVSAAFSIIRIFFASEKFSTSIKKLESVTISGIPEFHLLTGWFSIFYQPRLVHTQINCF